MKTTNTHFRVQPSMIRILSFTPTSDLPYQNLIFTSKYHTTQNLYLEKRGRETEKRGEKNHSKKKIKISKTPTTTIIKTKRTPNTQLSDFKNKNLEAKSL